MKVRKAILDDLDKILGVYDKARSYMRLNGNKSQWINGYPSSMHVKKDIEEGNCYVGEENGDILMAFAFIIGDDPTYNIIEEGRWINEKPYGTIHRLGSNGKKKGMLSECINFCLRNISNIRIDTHKNNKPMINGLKSLGFCYCGIIYCQDGTQRLAFQLDKNSGLNISHSSDKNEKKG